MVTFISLGFGATITLLLIGVFRGNRGGRTVTIRDRVEQLAPEAHAHDAYDDSFAERLLLPLGRWFMYTLGTATPSRLTQAVAERLNTAGMSITPGRFVAVWLTFALIIPVTLFVVSAPIVGVSAPMLIMFGAWIGLGGYLPWFFLQRAAGKRTQEIDRRLPDAIDLIVTCVESGIGLQAAMIKVSEYVEGPVADEFTRVSREVSVGRERAEAMEAMADRTGSREMRLLVRAIVQAEQMGISIGSVLRNQADEVRERRKQKAREKAGTIPVKITIPTVLFIFPTIFLLVLGPVALNTMEFFAER